MRPRSDIATLYARTAAALGTSAALAERGAALCERRGETLLAGREHEAAAQAHRAAERALREVCRIELRQQADALFARPRSWGLRLREGGPAATVSPDAELPPLRAAVIGVDLRRSVRLWNRGAVALYGWSAAEVLGRSLVELMIGPSDAGVADRILESVRSAGSWEGEFWVLRRDRRRLLVYVRDVLALADDGRPAGVVGVSVALPWEHGAPPPTVSSVVSRTPARG